MYTFEKRDEGLLAVRVSDGKPVACIDTKTVSFDDSPRLKYPEKVVTPIPREKWVIHFTACRLTPGEVETFAKELSAQEG